MLFFKLKTGEGAFLGVAMASGGIKLPFVELAQTQSTGSVLI